MALDAGYEELPLSPVWAATDDRDGREGSCTTQILERSFPPGYKSAILWWNRHAVRYALSEASCKPIPDDRLDPDLSLPSLEGVSPSTSPNSPLRRRKAQHQAKMERLRQEIESNMGPR